MANDGKIYITISDTRSGNSGVSTQTPNTTTHPKIITTPTISQSIGNEVKELVGETTLFAALSFTKETVSNSINLSINNIGALKGEYQSRENINNIIRIAGKMAGLATSFAVNPVLGLFATASTVYNDVVRINQEKIEINKANQKIELLRARTGGLYNESRGTND